MTIEEFWAAIHYMGLTQTRVPSVFKTRDGTTVYVDDPVPHDARQRAETIAILKFKVLGIEPDSSLRRAEGQPLQ
jgi:hypothetical protein